MNAIQFFQSFANPFLDGFFQAITMFGEDLFILLVITLTYWCFDKKFGYRLGFAYLSSMTLNGVIKDIFKIPRPFNKNGIRSLRIKTATGYSFPSGHTQGSSTFFITIIQKINKNYFYLLGIILILLICISRLYLGVHTLLDVCGGLLFGISWALISNKFMDYVENGKEHLLMLLLIPILIGTIFCTSSDYFKAAGICCSFIIGFFIETKYIKFEAKQPLKIQIIKYLIGIIIAVAIKSSFKIFLPKNNLGEFIRFFALGIWVTILAPYIFSKISKKHKKPSL